MDERVREINLKVFKFSRLSVLPVFCFVHLCTCVLSITVFPVFVSCVLCLFNRSYKVLLFSLVESHCRTDKFHKKKFDIFNIFAQNMDCGYMLELLCQGGSNVYPQSMFYIKNNKNKNTIVYPSFTI